jgi:hypothetical protein
VQTAYRSVYVQTSAAPNEVIAFRRTDDGSFDLIGSVATVRRTYSHESGGKEGPLATLGQFLQ